ncbi:MAG: trypsin-like peptidase domain-containing protein, partial [Anaerolineae bacterium]|nr:trypsin-like peptidase domain-containing protein [Anaerolineae bacterium]
MSKPRLFGLTVFALLLFTSWKPLKAQESLDVDRLQRATVFVMQAQNVGDNLIVTCISSGTLVSRDGLILTNAHSTVPSSACPGNTILIGLNIRPNEPPITQYRAEIAQADSGLDLALLRITRELDGRLVDRSALGLPFVEIADSGSTALDDTIVIVGFPGIGDDPIQVVRGTVNGFVLEPRSRSGTAWIKTSAEIPGTMSGGGAYDRAGRLVGIPTTAPLSSASSPQGTCIPI